MASTKKTVLITGSTRGIGLAFAEHYINAGWNVIGTARAGSKTDKLAALSPFKIVTLDTGDETTITEAARQLEGVPIDLLINNAGIGKFTTFETVTKETIMHSMEVNALGPFLTTRALLPNLKLASEANGLAKVLQISSIMGSIGSNKDEYLHYFRGQYAYTASKAALNMITRVLAADLRESNVAVVAINPGIVATDINNHQGAQPSEAIATMADIVSKLSLEDTDKFLSGEPSTPGAELPW